MVQQGIPPKVIKVARPRPQFQPSPAATGRDVREATTDLAAYPILTEPISPSALPLSASSTGGGANLGQVVDQALREVLGWRPNSSDVTGFTAALSNSFTTAPFEGRTITTWTPKSYAVQADLGAVTGAQASLWTRAKAALDQSLPLLDGLYPLDPASDPEDCGAVRSIVVSEFKGLVNELQADGGPIPQRVDTLFSTLIGADPSGRVGVPIPSVPEDIKQGTLAELRRIFGLRRHAVNTVDEEQNLSNFLVVADYICGLQQSWVAQRPFFDRNPNNTPTPYFGTQMVLLSRGLAVVAESVRDVYFTMDSVFLRGPERQTIELSFDPADPPLFVAELLAWVDRFASDEGPRLIRDGGKTGVAAFFPTIDRLRDLVRGATTQSHTNPNIPPAYFTERVQRSLRQLADQLAEAGNQARAFQGFVPRIVD